MKIVITIKIVLRDKVINQQLRVINSLFFKFLVGVILDRCEFFSINRIFSVEMKSI